MSHLEQSAAVKQQKRMELEGLLATAKRKIQLVYTGADLAPVQLSQREAWAVGRAIECYLQLLDSKIGGYL